MGRMKSDRDVVVSKTMKYPFSETLPYFITQISTTMMEIVSHRFDEYGISIPMYRAMVVLRDGQVRNLGELANIVAIDQSTLSRQVGAMVKIGLVTRVRSENNGRIVLIEITSKGRLVVEELLPFVLKLEEAALEQMPPDEVQNFMRSLKRIEDNLAAFRDATKGIKAR